MQLSLWIKDVIAAFLFLFLVHFATQLAFSPSCSNVDLSEGGGGGERRQQRNENGDQFNQSADSSCGGPCRSVSLFACSFHRTQIPSRVARFIAFRFLNCSLFVRTLFLKIDFTASMVPNLPRLTTYTNTVAASLQKHSLCCQLSNFPDPSNNFFFFNYRDFKS